MKNIILTVIIIFILYLAVMSARFIIKKRANNLIKLRNPIMVIFFAASLKVIYQVNGFKMTNMFDAGIYLITIFSLIKCGDVIVDAVFFASHGKSAPTKLMRSIIAIVLYIIALFSVLKLILGVDLAPVITTSAIVSMVIGLALQDTLTNFIAGIVLHSEKSFKIDDFIKVGDIEGRVEEINWRTTKVATVGNGIYNVPNSTIVKQATLNYTTIDKFLVRACVSASIKESPNRVINTMMDVAQKHSEILLDPKPEVRITKYSELAADYELRVFIGDFFRRKPIETELMKNIWYGFQRSGINIPFPGIEVFNPITESKQERIEKNLSVIKTIEFFENLDQEVLEDIARTAKRRVYGIGEPLFLQGDKGDSFFIITRGKVEVIIDNEKVAELKKGEFFGEMSLFTGNKRSATVKSVEDSEFIVVDKEGFSEIMESDSKIAESISTAIAKREIENENKKKHDNDSAAFDKYEMNRKQKNILDKIRSFFEL